MAKAQVIAAPIKGALGNEVNVGDTVMVVTTGYSHRVRVSKGKYVGYIQSKGYYPQRARIEVEKERSILVKPDGTDFDWKRDYNHNTWSTVRPTLTNRTEKYIQQSTLCLNRIATITPAEAQTVEKVGKLV
jgi:uncharacterized membrane protein YcgQ (UPF0703/DUF1980 family)